MSDPYRSTENPECPTCKVALTAMQQRLVCERCHRLLIPRAELEEALFEVGSQHVELVETTSLRRACPRCASPLINCQVRVTVVTSRLMRSKTIELDDVAACRDHGVWVSQDALARMFAAVGQATSSRGGRF